LVLVRRQRQPATWHVQEMQQKHAAVPIDLVCTGAVPLVQELTLGLAVGFSLDVMPKGQQDELFPTEYQQLGAQRL